jgi:hypothetical protein
MRLARWAVRDAVALGGEAMMVERIRALLERPRGEP